jgi:flagellar biosynthetic protein FliR
MEALISLIDQKVILAFLLLLARILSFVMFMPVFGHKSINSTTKVAISFYFAIFLFPLINYDGSILSEQTFILSLLSEITLGLVSSFLVQIVFSAVQIIGDLIGYATTLSMANMFDPATGGQQGVVGRFLYMIVLVLYFQTDMYEITLLALGQSFDTISLGAFNLFDYDGINLAIKEIANMFIFAFSFAFPLFFISFIMDVYYGYGTKSMPAFSPFVITFQVKFTLIFVFMMLGFDTFVNIFKTYFMSRFL